MKNISVSQAKEMLDKNEAILIDVREKEEFDAEHIHKAIFLPLSSFSQHVMNIDNKGKKLIFQCKLGGRSAKACEIYMSVFGDNNIYNLEGGIEAWKNSGLKIETNIKSN